MTMNAAILNMIRGILCCPHASMQWLGVDAVCPQNLDSKDYIHTRLYHTLSTGM
jgi:hypothetical protein